MNSNKRVSPFWNTKPLPKCKYRSGMPVNLFGDKDRDGVMNVFDCRPGNRRRQDNIVYRKVRLHRKPETYLRTTQGPRVADKWAPQFVNIHGNEPTMERQGKVKQIRKELTGIRKVVDEIRGNATIIGEGGRTEIYKKPLYHAGRFKDLFQAGNKVVVSSLYRRKDYPVGKGTKAKQVLSAAQRPKTYSKHEWVRKLEYNKDKGIVKISTPDKVAGPPIEVAAEADIYYEPWTMDRGSYLFEAPPNAPPELKGKQLKLMTEGDPMEIESMQEEIRKGKPEVLQTLPEIPKRNFGFSYGNWESKSTDQKKYAHLLKDVSTPLKIREAEGITNEATGKQWAGVTDYKMKAIVLNKNIKMTEKEKARLIAHEIGHYRLRERGIKEDEDIGLSAQALEELKKTKMYKNIKEEGYSDEKIPEEAFATYYEILKGPDMNLEKMKKFKDKFPALAMEYSTLAEGPELQRVQLNKNEVLRFVDKDTGHIHQVSSGVDDPKWGTSKSKKDYPQQYKYHQDYNRKAGDVNEVIPKMEDKIDETIDLNDEGQGPNIV